MTRHVKRGGKVYFRSFPDKPVTQKPAETRMGSGKGNPELWVAVVHPGRVLFELAGVDEALAACRHGARHPEAAVQGPLRGAPGHPRPRRGGDLMPTAHDLAMLDGDELRPAWASRGASCSTCASSWPPASWTTRRASSQVRREVARMLTVLREREILEAEGAYVADGGRARGGPGKLAAEDAEREEKAAAAGGGRGRGGDEPCDRARPATTITDDDEEDEA